MEGEDLNPSIDGRVLIVWILLLCLCVGIWIFIGSIIAQKMPCLNCQYIEDYNGTKSP